MFELLLLILGAVFVKKQVLDKPRAVAPTPQAYYPQVITGGLLPSPEPTPPSPVAQYPAWQAPTPAPEQVLTPAKPTTACPTGKEWVLLQPQMLAVSGAPTPSQWSCQPVRTSPMPHVTVRTIAANEGGGGCCEYVPKTTRILVEPCPPGQVRDSSGPVCAKLCAERNDPNLQAVPIMGRCVGQGTVAAPGQTCKPGPGVVCPAPLPPNYPGMTVPSGGVSCPQKYPNASSMPPVYRPRLKTMKGLGVPANPTPRAVAQPNGIKFLLRLNGDERCHWNTNAENNWPVVQRADGYWVYAAVGSNGRHEQTNQIVGVVCPAIGG